MGTVYRRRKRCGQWESCFRGKYRDEFGVRRDVKLRPVSDGQKVSAKVLADIEATARLRASGLLPPAPKPAPTARFVDSANEYLAWGVAQGGLGGRPWSSEHARITRARLDAWHRTLKVDVLAQIELSAVERHVQDMQQTRAPRTVFHYAMTLRGFVHWCVARGMLLSDPLANMGRLSGETRQTRRALSGAEIAALLRGAPDGHRVAYLTALCTGFRRGELKALTRGSLDAEAGVLSLPAEATKNRHPARQPIPQGLAAMLGKERKHPAAPLLDVSCAELSDTFELHRERAGIAKDTPMGTVTLHSLRHTYITLLDAAGATHAQREALARHQESARITARYTHVADAELRRVVEGLWRIVEEAVGAADKPKEAQA